MAASWSAAGGVLGEPVTDAGLSVRFSSPLVAIGIFTCPPGDWRWRAQNCADDGHLVVFPQSSVTIEHERHGRVLTDANVTLFYNQGDTFRRELGSRLGDRCTVLIATPRLLHQIAASEGLPMRDVERRPFAAFATACEAASYIAQHDVLAALNAGPTPGDRSSVEEGAVALVRGSLLRLFGRRGRPDRLTTKMRSVVREAQLMLGQDLDGRLRLADVANAVDVSPYHLMRSFKAATGMTLHAYRDALRLRASLGAVGRTDVRLTDVAFDLGYSGSSHFTDRFHRHFGMPPSALRRRWAGADPGPTPGIPPDGRRRPTSSPVRGGRI